MSEKTYKIGNTEFIQRQLTLGQIKKIGKIYFQALNRAGELENFTFERVQVLIERFNLIGYFFAIILRPKINIFTPFTMLYNLIRLKPLYYVNADNAPYGIVGEIFKDFFLLNGSLIGKFVNLESGLGLIVKQAMATQQEATDNGSTNHSKSSPEE